MPIPVIIAGQKTNYQQRTQSYNMTIAPSDWQAIPGEDKFSCTKMLTTIKCGLDGTIPPIITPVNYESEYSKIDSANATPGVGITFIIPTRPEENIDIIVVDFR